MAESKLAWRAFWPVASVLLAGALFVHCVGQHAGGPATAAAPLDDWDVPRLVAYLNGKGLALRAVSTRKGGGGDRTAFLTTTDQGWEELNRLPRGPARSAACPGGEDWDDLIRQWGDCCQVVGPFLLYGDRELLGRVRAALSDCTDR